MVHKFAQRVIEQRHGKDLAKVLATLRERARYLLSAG